MSQESARNLDQLRQRLNTLATSLSALRRDLETNELLPSWPSIQASANLLLHNLASLNATLSAAQPLLTSAHAYPLPTFSRAQEDLLGQLLRKKLQPPVEDWIEQGVKHASQLSETGLTNGAAARAKEEAKHLNTKQIEDLWNWAGPEGNRIARGIGEDAFNDVFTLAEQEDGIENVVTGLRRKFWESDDEDEPVGQETVDKMEVDPVDKRPEIVKSIHRPGMDGSKPMLPLEAVLRFVNSGVFPTQSGPVPIRR